eukprot:4994193-Prymnesium_polylepis.1
MGSEQDRGVWPRLGALDEVWTRASGAECDGWRCACGARDGVSAGGAGAGGSPSAGIRPT